MMVPVPDLLEEVAVRRHAVQVDLIERYRMTSGVDADLEELFLLGRRMHDGSQGAQLNSWRDLTRIVRRGNPGGIALLQGCGPKTC
jgi:hypothetical protein